ncbi:hypothetical protein G9C85_17390 [Halorubellus sp. JP-L1]|uniref:LVIVD repeat-containing protein n=1 Tax=Halorubellus sp. JP-L1 TaxID=2715753 RepID=UPI001407779A|nr:hypothetical protein [Halorubellus sp. JP-L1]NHN43394.1 hypothetical protein [Halorubellus sp. JP-L1]
MSQRGASGRWSRRCVLAGLAAAGSASVLVDDTTGDAGRAPGAFPTVEPAGRLDLDGVAEAVVGDDGETVYCALGDGFAVVDASNPFDPTVVHEDRDLRADGDAYSRMVSVMDVKVSGDRLLVPGPSAPPEFLSGFFLFDVSDPADPERVAFQDLEFGPHNAFVEGEFVYLTGSGEFGEPVVVYDVHDDDDPEEVARWTAADADDAWGTVPRTYRNCHDVFVQDDVLYVAYWDAGTWVVDVSDPTDPTAIARLGGHDPKYLAALDGLSAEFDELPGNSHSVLPNADASALFVSKEAHDVPTTLHEGGPGGIECWDLRALDVDGVEPSVESVLSPPAPRGDRTGSGWTAHNVGVDGDRLYTSWHGGGVRVYDVADLAEPLLLGEWRDPERTWFWTARPLESGFVATSYLQPQYSLRAQRQGDGARLYVFPDPDEDDAVPAPTMDRRPFPDPADATDDADAAADDDE